MSLFGTGDEISDRTPMYYHENETVLLLPNPPSRATKIKNGITMSVLFLINLLNFMDRYAIAGVLKDIKTYYSINDKQAGLLQTVFICSYMALAPAFGYLGDRYSRKVMIIFGVTLWSLTTLLGSFVPEGYFTLFMLSRGLVGVGEASYSCVAPTIIADMYKDDTRTKMLALFNIAVPLGSGLGYIVGSKLSQALGGWQWGLRFTPILGAVCVFMLIVLVREPPRGGNEGANIQRKSSWFADVREVMKIKSFILITLAFTWVSFALGSLSFWGPIFLEKGDILAHNGAESTNEDTVALYFGLVAAGAGIIGVLLGTEVARRYRRINPRGDPIICGSAVLLAMPFLYFVLILSNSYIIVVWIFIFIAQTLLCSNWGLITDMLMYIIIPSRRSTASSIQIFIMHLFGDATSPFIIGVISDFLKEDADDHETVWIALRDALMITPFIATLGGAAFLFAALYIVQDRRKADLTVQLNAYD